MPKNQDVTPFYWLWRSRFRDYDRHARILHRWLCRLMLDLGDIRRSRGPDWQSGFEVYDLMDSPSGRDRVRRYSTYQRYVERLDLLHDEMDAASPRRSAGA